MRRSDPLGEQPVPTSAATLAGRERGVLVPYVQAYLPYVRLGARQIAAGDTQTTPFAHPFERAFAELLTFYGVPWCYEPTSFALTWTEDGLPREMFTPDFYLPDHRVYIELTAMRQRLVTRKHRKIRRLRELYPQVDVKLLYRRDYERIARSFGRRRGSGRAIAGHAARRDGDSGEAPRPRCVDRQRSPRWAGGARDLGGRWWGGSAARDPRRRSRLCRSARTHVVQGRCGQVPGRRRIEARPDYKPTPVRCRRAASGALRRYRQHRADALLCRPVAAAKRGDGC